MNTGKGANRLTDATLYSTATGGSNIPGSVDVRFNYLSPILSASIGEVVGSYTYFATLAKGTPATLLPNNAFQQTGISGQFSLLSTTVITFLHKDYAIGSNLLSGMFGGSILSGTLKGTSGSTFSSTAAGNPIVFTSDFLDFTHTFVRDRGLTLTAVARPFGIASNGALRNFRATIGGQFSSNPAPIIVGSVPEPSGLGLMAFGIGMISFAVRRQRAIAA